MKNTVQQILEKIELFQKYIEVYRKIEIYSNKCSNQNLKIRTAHGGLNSGYEYFNGIG